MEWTRIGVRQWIETKAEEKRRSSAEDSQRTDPFEKCHLWRWAMARHKGPAADAFYLDLLDQGTVDLILNHRWKAELKDRNVQGWAKIHEEFKLLPRCPVHDTVSLFIHLGPYCYRTLHVWVILKEHLLSP